MLDADETVRFGVYAGQAGVTMAEYLDLVRHAEELGFDCFYTFDHFRPPDAPTMPCFEAIATVAALASITHRIRCGTLVLAVPYRHPAILAVAAATIDHVSDGRFELGLGAGGGDGAETQYRLPDVSIPRRMVMLDEACEVVRRLWSEETTTYDGEIFGLDAARFEPKPVQYRVPLIIGGSGERRLLRIAAAHADIWNTFASDLATYEGKRDALDRHCRAVGRDPASIRRSVVFRALLDTDRGHAEARFERTLGPLPPAARGWAAVGTPDDCAAALEPYFRLGVRDFILATRPPFDTPTLDLVAREVAPRLRGR